ncbi:hypothetical protein GCM10009665_70390 [Kitasatospora nipponensis]|uniref:Uncharacterized protein n=1 Tax=Kitasatospora nipponensis TaxID=258049 RepID=A0ABP4HR61_9ACTN
MPTAVTTLRHVTRREDIAGAFPWPRPLATTTRRPALTGGRPPPRPLPIPSSPVDDRDSLTDPRGASQAAGRGPPSSSESRQQVITPQTSPDSPDLG